MYDGKLPLISEFCHHSQHIPDRDAEGVEYEQEGERDKIYEIAAQFNRFQSYNFNE